MAAIDAPSSYTQRRAHAAGHAPPTHRWRASFGAGSTLVFGSRAVHVADYAVLDERCRNADEGSQQQQRAEAALRVHVDARRAGAAQTLAETLCLYKDTAAAAATGGGLEEVPQQALEEQHVWKLVGALFLPAAVQGTVADEGDSSLLASASAPPAAALRQREALRGWLRNALWDSTALACATANGRVGEEASQLERLWALMSSLHSDDAVKEVRICVHVPGHSCAHACTCMCMCMCTCMCMCIRVGARVLCAHRRLPYALTTWFTRSPLMC